MSEDDALPEPDAVAGAPHPRHAGQVFGQAHAEAAFLEAFNGGRMHHAWLISGPKGVGKATLAWQIARFLLTQEGESLFGPPGDLAVDPNSPVIAHMAALAEPRLLLCRRPWDPKTKRLKTAITIDEVRKLKGFFNLSAADGGWRVAIIDAADELNTSAANGLLKILEEPPEKVVILLIAHQPSKLLPTIRSRCRSLRCDTLSEADMGKVLAQVGQTDSMSPALATLSGGAPGQAIRLLADDCLKLYGQIIGLIGTAPGLDRGLALALADKCAARGNESIYALMIELITLALVRLARHGAGMPMVEAANGELALAQKLAANAHQSRIWANLQQEISAKTTHARAVNLDPAQVILDTFMQIDKAARRVS
ncbi:MAG TPA: DNA polymerase III subunit delta' [Rhodobacteraceae bacterium]|nr:DNA polymerase III subunit delta' [Paracoccaceae bacterium]